MASAAAPHSTASIWRTVGVLSRDRLNRLPRPCLKELSAAGVVMAISLLTQPQLFFSVGKRQRGGLLPASDNVDVADRAAGDDNRRPLRRRPVKTAGHTRINLQHHADFRHRSIGGKGGYQHLILEIAHQRR